MTTPDPATTEWIPLAVSGGLKGDKGDKGDVWIYGTGDPSGGTDPDGTLYLDGANGNVWEKQSGSWVFTGINIKGPIGNTGAPGVVKPFLTGHTFALAGDLSLFGTLPSFFIPKAATEVVEIIGLRAKIASGTSVGVQVRKNAANVGGVITVTPTAAYTALGPVTCADGDETTIVLSALTGTPTSLGATITVRVTPS